MSELTFRVARADDLAAVVTLLNDDELSENREKAMDGTNVPAEYAKAFSAMERETFNHILLAEMDGRIVGALQLVYVPGLSRRGATRAIVEAVRVVSGLRGQNIGTALMKEAIRRAKEDGCVLVQLTSDVRRTRAHLFYRRLGFIQSHFGFKRDL